MVVWADRHAGPGRWMSFKIADSGGICPSMSLPASCPLFIPLPLLLHQFLFSIISLSPDFFLPLHQMLALFPFISLFLSISLPFSLTHSLRGDRAPLCLLPLSLDLFPPSPSLPHLSFSQFLPFSPFLPPLRPPSLSFCSSPCLLHD